MGVLRSCYTTQARFWADPGAPAIPIIWYFAPPGAKVFTGKHSFMPLSDGISATDDNSLGELEGAPRTWRNGSMPGPFRGTNFCGNADWFAVGQGMARHKDIGPNGLPCCCDGNNCLILDQRCLSTLGLFPPDPALVRNDLPYYPGAMTEEGPGLEGWRVVHPPSSTDFARWYCQPPFGNMDFATSDGIAGHNWPFVGRSPDATLWQYHNFDDHRFPLDTVVTVTVTF